MDFENVRKWKQANKKKEQQENSDKLVSFIDLFTLVCVQFGVVSVEYFLDKMKPYELSIICNSLHLRFKDSWEQSRLIAYLIAQTNSKKRLKPSDIIKFPWEQKVKDAVEKRHEELTLAEYERIKAKALEREKKLKEKGLI